MQRDTGFEVEVAGKTVEVVPVDWMRGYSYLLAGPNLFVPDLGDLTPTFAKHALARIAEEQKQRDSSAGVS